jgi:hypothetical protein
MRTSTLSKRAGYVDAQATLIRASLIAAHSANLQDDGFRAVDVRFYFRLFSNWLEQDILRPSLDLELTQIRRSLQALERAGHCSQSRNKRFRLTEDGLLELVEKLVDEVGVSFEEVLFVQLIAVSYRDILRARILTGSAAISSATRRRLGAMLDPKRISKRLVRNAERLVNDLERRLLDDAALEKQIGRLREEGFASVELIARLTGVGAYQLQRIRSFSELLLQLPEDLRAAELSSGIGARRQMIFLPLLARARAELHQLQQLALSFDGAGRGSI